MRNIAAAFICCFFTAVNVLDGAGNFYHLTKVTGGWLWIGAIIAFFFALENERKQR